MGLFTSGVSAYYNGHLIEVQTQFAGLVWTHIQLPNQRTKYAFRQGAGSHHPRRRDSSAASGPTNDWSTR